MNRQKIVAREWLFFLAFFIFGVFIWPWPFIAIFGSPDIRNPTKVFEMTFKNLLFINKDDNFIFWLFILSPYFGFQLLRTVIWAIKVLKK
jgi:hypothetical protein